VVVGCVGFLTEGPPEHVLTLVEAMKLDVVARSARGPVSLAIVGPDGAACDDDTGTGHAPRLSLLAPGRYEIWVAARLSADARLPYELSITKNDKSRVRLGAPGSAGENVATAGAATDSTVSVTVTSEPSGAEVRTPGGQVLGTTPAMFVYPATAGELAGPLAFMVAPRGQPATRVEGRAQNGELVLHAAIATVVAAGGPMLGTPGETIQSAVPQRIRDFTTVTQGAEYAGDCTIAELAVTVDIRHSCVSDLRVSLRSPSGANSILQNHSMRRLSARTFTFRDSRSALSRFVGQSARGRWEISVRDDADVDVGSFDSFSIAFTCGGGAATTAIPGGASGRMGSAPVPNSGNTPTVARLVNPWGIGGLVGSSARPIIASPPAVRAAPLAMRRTTNEMVDPWQ
jgi:subtilisin-like proprotein convertase family protein